MQIYITISSSGSQKAATAEDPVRHKNMFGKYSETLSTSLDNNSLQIAIRNWAEENKLLKVETTENFNLYRFGNPFISNPIYIHLEFAGDRVKISGWVQTLIPSLRWKVVPTSNVGLDTTLDYRRKGGLFCNKLKEKIAKPFD